MSLTQMQQVSGRGAIADGTKTATLLASAAGKRVLVKAVQICITVASSGGAGIVTLRDGTGGTVLWQDSAAAVKSFATIVFGDDYGYPLTVGNGLSFEVSGATTDATAIAIAIGFIQ